MARERGEWAKPLKGAKSRRESRLTSPHVRVLSTLIAGR